MISRRPNRRASREKAPGPRKAIAVKIAAPNTGESPESKSNGSQAGSNASLMEIAPKPMRAPARGVRRPNNSKAPETMAARLTNQIPAVASAL